MMQRLSSKIRKIFTSIGVIWLLVFALAGVATIANAQDALQLGQAGTDLGLLDTQIQDERDIRDIVVRIVRYVIGFLGLVAVVVVIYGGYLYMTSAGNADRVQRARSTIVNGLIGLVIVLLAYGIVSFVVRLTTDLVGGPVAEQCDPLIDTTRSCTTGGCSGVQTCESATSTWGSCVTNACTPGARFTPRLLSPSGDNNPVNSIVVMRFSMNTQDIATMPAGTVTVKADADLADGVPGVDVPGSFKRQVDANGVDRLNTIVFVPSAICTEDTTQFCFDKNVRVTVNIAGLKADDNTSVTCNNGCEWDFGIGEGFDRADPTVTLVAPRGVVARSSNAKLQLRGRDDFKISSGRFDVSGGLVDGVEFGGTDVSWTGNPRQMDLTSQWNTNALTVLDEYDVTATVEDMRGGRATVTQTVRVVEQWCVNGQLDAQFGETDIDCGPSTSGCAPCGAPIITRIEPADAAPGDYIQISGRYFGDAPGVVKFSGDDEVFDTTDPVGVAPIACDIASTWTDRQIIIQVPPFDLDNDGTADTTLDFLSHIQVTNDENDSGDTTLWSPAPLRVNTNVKRPSICEIAPDEIRQCAALADRAVTVTGVKFGGDSVNKGKLLFGDISVGATPWLTVVANANEATATLPTVGDGLLGVRVESPEGKYCMGGTDAWTACSAESDCSTGKCEAPTSNPLNLEVLSCIPKPVIDSITPDSGPKEQIVTIKGTNFGTSVRQVLFTSGSVRIPATFDFNNQCSATAYWKDTQIVARVPNEVALVPGAYGVVVQTKPSPNPIESDPVNFTVNTSALAPALICALPDNGPLNTPVRVIGEQLGAATGTVTFSNNISSTVTEWTESVVSTSVPENAVTGPLGVANSGGVQSANKLAFTVGSCQQGGCAAGTVCCGDGTCRATREECPVPPAKPLSSYRWRVTTGDPAPRVIEQAQCLVNFVQNWSFENTYDDAGEKKPSNWGSASDLVNVDIVEDAPHGDYALLTTEDDVILNQKIPVPVTVDETLVVKFWAKSSGPKNIDVQLYPSSGSVTAYLDESVQVNGDWKEYTITGQASNVSSSELTLIVDTGVHLDRFSIQSSDASSSTTQSPSPYIDTQDACLNSAISLRFTTPLSTVTGELGTLTLTECNNGPTDSKCDSPTRVDGYAPSLFGTDGIFIDTGGFASSTLYKAKLEGVKSNKGVPMQAPYEWSFRTGDDNCAIAGASCSPRRHTLTTSTESVALSAGLQALNCNILSCATGDVSWVGSSASTSNPPASMVTQLRGAAPYNACTVNVDVITPDPREGKDKYRPTISNDAAALVGMCEIDVKFSPLEVSGVFPKCNAVCPNARPVIAFSVPVKVVLPGSLPVGQYKLEKCADSSCVTTSLVDLSANLRWIERTNFSAETLRGLNLPTNAGHYFEARDSLGTPLPLDPNSWYKVTIKGGPTGVKSVDNKELQGGDYTWIFGTKSETCGVARLSVAPAEKTVRTIGATVDYSADVFSTGDVCAPGGQLLNADSYEYRWSSADTTIATISQTDSRLATPPVNARQVATVVGQSEDCVTGDNTCTTNINAAENISNKGGFGTLTLQCGFTAPGQCLPLKDSNILINGGFEAGYTAAIGDNDGWMDFVNYGHQLILVDSFEGSQHLRSAGAFLTVVTLPQAGNTSGLQIRLHARTQPENSVNLKPNISIQDTALSDSMVYFIETSTDDSNLTNEWREYIYEIDSSQLTTAREYIVFFDTSDNTEIDDIRLYTKGCTNNPGRSCVVNNDCNIDASGQNLNLCGLDNLPNGTCNPPVAGVRKCSNDSNLTCTTNFDCKLAVNPNGCCGVRPYVKDIKYATYETETATPETKICLNSGFAITFSGVMDELSLNDRIRLEWKDSAGDGTPEKGTPNDCDLEKQLKFADSGFFSKIFAFIKSLFGFDAQAAGDTWCGVPTTYSLVVEQNPITGLSTHTVATIYPDQLLNPKLHYRIVVDGETDDNPTGGVRSVYSVQLREEDSNFTGTLVNTADGNFVQKLVDPKTPTTVPVRRGGGDVVLVGDRICDISSVEVSVNPALPQGSNIISSPIQPRDLFQCVGDNCVCSETNPVGSPGCRLTPGGAVPEDQKVEVTGNQHEYIATALSENRGPLSADWKWQQNDPLEILKDEDPNWTTNIAYPTIETDLSDGLAQMRVGATPKGAGQFGLSDAGASNIVSIVFDRCKDRWGVGELKDSGATGSMNFKTTYCRDREEGGPLPDLRLSAPLGVPSPNNPLNILNEWILSYIDPAESVDAIAVRVVKNTLHLTPQQWYNEQSFEKGSPRVVDGGVDGYQAIVDGRTAYIGFANVNDSQSNLYSNILIISHSQNANPDTVEIFNRLVQNLTFNINKLNAGQCRAIQKPICTAGDPNKLGNECELSSECNSPITPEEPTPTDGRCGVVLENRSCLTDNDCSEGFVCNNDKSKITRDLTRFTRLLDVQGKLIDYQYGTSCPNVTPGAPGDADCNGVINGRDVVRAQSYVKATPVAPPSFCKGSDFDLNNSVTSADVGAIQQLVRQQCTRPAGRSSSFPRLNEGTFVENMTTSVWPSWQETFGRDLGGGLPTDPINLFSQCGGGIAPGPFPHSPYTCWDPNTRTYASFNTTLNAGNLVNADKKPDVPAGRVVNGTNLGSHVYTYASYDNGSNYALCSYFEYNAVPTDAAIGQVSGAASNNRVCLVSDNSVSSRLPTVPPYNNTIGDSGSVSFIPPNYVEVSLTVTGGGNGNVAMAYGGITNTCSKSPLFTTRCTLQVPTSAILAGTKLTMAPPTGATIEWTCPGTVTGITCEMELGAYLNGGRVNASLTWSAAATFSVNAQTPNASGTFATPVVNSGGPGVAVYVDGVQTRSINNITVGADLAALTNITGAIVGSLVEIVPNYGTDYVFAGWGGPCASSQNGSKCSYVIESATPATTTTLKYRPRGRLLQVEINAIAGDFGGDVYAVNTTNPRVPVLGDIALVDCVSGQSTCRAFKFYPNNPSPTVYLAAIPDTGKSVDSANWSGCTGSVTIGLVKIGTASPVNASICPVDMSRDRVARVRFGVAQPTLEVSKTTNNGSVISTTSTDPAGLAQITCGDGCTVASPRSATYEYGDKVTLALDINEELDVAQNPLWECRDTNDNLISGPDCVISDNAVTVTLSQSMKVKARLTSNTVDLNLIKTNGSDSIITVKTLSGRTVATCGAGTTQCNNLTKIPLPADGKLKFEASIPNGKTFTNWTIGTTTCTTNVCEKTGMTAGGSYTATAAFGVAKVKLNVTRAGEGGGTYSYSEPNTPTTCATSFDSCRAYDSGVTAIITATPSAGTNVSWSFCESNPTPNTCRVVMTSEKNVVIAFNVIQHTITVQNTGPGNVEVRADGVLVDTIVGTQTKAVVVDEGAEVILKPIANAGSSHIAWGAVLADNCYTTTPGSDCTLGEVTATNPLDKRIKSFFAGNETLSIRKDGTGKGTVNITINGVTESNVPLNDNPAIPVTRTIAQGANVYLSFNYPAGVNGNPSPVTYISHGTCPTGTFSTATNTCSAHIVTGPTEARVRYNTPPQFTDNTMEGAEGDMNVTRTLLATDTDLGSDNYSITYTQGASGSVNCTVPVPVLAAASCVYTPNDPNFNGTDTFEYVFSDGRYNTGLTPGSVAWNAVKKTVTVTINEVNDLPTITQVKCSTPLSATAGLDFIDDCTIASGYPVTDGQILELYCSANDLDGDALTYSWSQVGADSLEIPVPNSDLPNISIPVRENVFVERTGSLNYGFSANVLPNIPYNHQGNAIVLFYSSSNIVGSELYNMPTIKLKHNITGVEYTFERLGYVIPGGSGTVMATYYLGPDSTGGVPLSGSYTLSFIMDVTTNSASGVSLVSYDNVAGLGRHSIVQGPNRDPVDLTLSGHSITSLQSTVVGGFMSPNTNGVFKFYTPSADNIGMINGNASTLASITNNINYSEVNCPGDTNYCNNNSTALPGVYRSYYTGTTNIKSVAGFYAGIFEVKSSNPQVSMESVPSGGHNNYYMKLAMVELLRPSLETQNLAFKCVVDDNSGSTVIGTEVVNVDRLIRP